MLVAGLRLLRCRSTQLVVRLTFQATPLRRHFHNSRLAPRATPTGGRAARPVAPGHPLAVHRAALRIANTIFICRARTCLTTMSCGNLLEAVTCVGPAVAAATACAPSLPEGPLAIHWANPKVTSLGLVELRVAALATTRWPEPDAAQAGLGALAAGHSTGRPLGPVAQRAIHRARIKCTHLLVIFRTPANMTSILLVLLPHASPPGNSSATGHGATLPVRPHIPLAIGRADGQALAGASV
mmetsp:Transcript_38984/g.90259  ORF Transcript_38984/g.90259 Transcript_38984/m.90259 type:complete len:241 (+) Transcript_38984:2405-3127(+)